MPTETIERAPAAPFVPPSDPVEQAPEPAFDEPALRAREEAVAEREQHIQDWIAAQREAGAPVTDRNVESMVVAEYAVCGFDAFRDQPNIAPDAERALRCITIIALVLRNGFTITGSSACASPENYNADEGRKEARAEALTKLWLCAEFALRNRLMGVDAIDPPAPIEQVQ